MKKIGFNASGNGAGRLVRAVCAAVGSRAGSSMIHSAGAAHSGRWLSSKDEMPRLLLDELVAAL
jgi:hypothetical protein